MQQTVTPKRSVYLQSLLIDWAIQALIWSHNGTNSKSIFLLMYYFEYFYWYLQCLKKVHKKCLERFFLCGLLGRAAVLFHWGGAGGHCCTAPRKVLTLNLNAGWHASLHFYSSTPVTLTRCNPHQAWLNAMQVKLSTSQGQFVLTENMCSSSVNSSSKHISNSHINNVKFLL